LRGAPSPNGPRRPGIINDNHISAASHERTAHRNRESPAPFGSYAFRLGILGKPYGRKQRAIPVACHNCAELAGEGCGKLTRVRDACKSLGWIVTERPSRECDGRAD